MNYDELSKKLDQLKMEDYIWLIYIGIIFTSLYANTFERKYFIHDDPASKDKYRKIMIFIFSILIIIYLYFLKSSFEDVKNLKDYDSDEKKNLTYLSLVASLLIAISGFIFLYIAIKDKQIEVELAFN